MDSRSQHKSSFPAFPRRPQPGDKGAKRKRSGAVLLLGETGSGKSTLVNYLFNFFMGGVLLNPRIGIPNVFYQATEGGLNSEKCIKDPTKSQTGKCHKYKFDYENQEFCFIDSPGLSDTSGVQQDDKNISHILEVAEATGALSAIVLIINGTVARATVNLRNTLTRMRGNLPDVLLENLIVVLTNCSNISYNFDFKSLYPWKIKRQNVFMMDNCALSRDPSAWKENPRIVTAMEAAWVTSMEEIQQMIKRISELDEKSTAIFKDLRSNREKIKEEMHGIVLEIKKLQQTQDELERAQSSYRTAMNDRQKYSNFKQSKEVEYTVLEDADYYSTICMTHTEKVCHDHCGLPETQHANSDVFKKCACMNGVRCSECECGHETHYHARKKLAKKKKTVEDILEDIKRQFDTSSARAQDSKAAVNRLGDDLKLLDRTLREKQLKIEFCCGKLQSICSAFNFADEMTSLLQTLETNARTLTSLKARQEADKMIKSIEELVHRLHCAKSIKRHSGQDPDDYYKDFDSVLAKARTEKPCQGKEVPHSTVEDEEDEEPEEDEPSETWLKV